MLSETYFKEYCDQRGWAYVSLEHIHERGIKKRILKFKKGFDRIYVKIPQEIIPEIEEISKPSNNSLSEPSYVYDFLTWDAGNWMKHHLIVDGKKKDFSWIEVKTGLNNLNSNQIRTLEKISLPLFRARVPNPLIESSEVTVYLDEVNSDYLVRNGLVNP